MHNSFYDCVISLRLESVIPCLLFGETKCSEISEHLLFPRNSLAPCWTSVSLWFFIPLAHSEKKKKSLVDLQMSFGSNSKHLYLEINELSEIESSL